MAASHFEYSFYQNMQKGVPILFIVAIFSSFACAIMIMITCGCVSKICSDKLFRFSGNSKILQLIVKLAQFLYGAKSVKLKTKKDYATNGHCVKIGGCYYKLSAEVIGALLYHVIITTVVLIAVFMWFLVDIKVTYSCSPSSDCFVFNYTAEYKDYKGVREIDVYEHMMTPITNCSQYSAPEQNSVQSIEDLELVRCYNLVFTPGTALALLGGFVLFVPRITFVISKFLSLTVPRYIYMLLCFHHARYSERKGLIAVYSFLKVCVILPTGFLLWLPNSIFLQFITHIHVAKLTDDIKGETIAIILLLLEILLCPLGYILLLEVHRYGETTAKVLQNSPEDKSSTKPLLPV